MSSQILSFIIFLPAVVAFVLMVATKNAQDTRNIAFTTTLIVLFLVLRIYIDFDDASGQLQFITNVPWISSFGIHYYVGLDGFSLTILMLIALLIPTAYLFLWHRDTKGYWINMLLIQSGVTGALLSLDIILFYMFWETMLLPIFLIIGIYGGKKRIFNTLKVTVFTMFGSLLMFFAILYLGIEFYNQFGYYSFTIDDLVKVNIVSYEMNLFLFLCFLVAFGLKIPIFPLHTWIMGTYKHAPTGGVFLLSSIMAKVGVYALVRFLIPLFPDIYIDFAYISVFFGIFGMIYFGISAIMQQEIKAMMAYSSASHLSFIAAGIFSLSIYGLNGSFYLMVAHAISTGGIFLLLGVLQYKVKTLRIDKLGGIAKQAPIFTIYFAIMLFTVIGIPGTSGFVSELLIIMGIYEFNKTLGVLAALSVLVAVSFMIWMFQRVILQKTHNEVKMRDLYPREIIGMLPWVVLVIVMGIYPEIFMNKFEATIQYYLGHILQVSGGI
jgi:NADH-quinone oxidoreductase subunit M